MKSLNKGIIKKILLGIGLAFSVVSIVVLIILNSTPYKVDSPYSVRNSFQKNTFEIRIILKNNGEGYMSELLNGVPQQDDMEFKYTVSNGNLYIYDDVSGEYKLSGIISSYQLQFSNEGTTLVFQNDSSVTLNTLAIIGLVLGIGSILAYVVLYILDRKKQVNSSSNENDIKNIINYVESKDS